MLAVGHRLRRRDEFAATIRAGTRAGRGCVVAHLASPSDLQTTERQPNERQPNERQPGHRQARVRAGFVVSRAVGNAVTRNRVKRRLRHLTMQRLAGLPPGTELVIRASPGAATCSYEQLGADLDAAIAAARTKPRGRKAGTST